MKGFFVLAIPKLKTVVLFFYLGPGLLDCIVHTYLPAITENQLQSLNDILDITTVLWTLET